MISEVPADELRDRRVPPVPVWPRRSRYPGRRAVDDRAAPAAIVRVLGNDAPWREPPAGLGRGHLGDPLARAAGLAVGDAGGVLLAATVTGAQQLIPLVEAAPAIRGRPRRRPRCLIADRGYDHDVHRRALSARLVTPIIARGGVELGRQRWPEERRIGRLRRFHRSCTRW